jgi:hypothetical protein
MNCDEERRVDDQREEQRPMLESRIDRRRGRGRVVLGQFGAVEV